VSNYTFAAAGVSLASYTAACGAAMRPNYSEQCLKLDSSAYDCAGGSGNGPDYVQGAVTVVGVE